MKTIFRIVIVFFALMTLHANEIDGMEDSDKFIYTVGGKTNVENLNFSLTHEHIMSNFGAAPNYDPGYNTELLFNQVIPYLEKIKLLGVSTIFDCTTAYFGRDVKILKALSDSTGIQIVTNTGFYGANNDYYIPEIAFTSSEEEIAQIWTSEFENGIDQTGIKPGFIKLGFDDGTPSEIDKKLFRAGILAHLNTGLTLVVHTGNNPAAAAEQLKLLDESKVSANAWVWVHANKITNLDLLFEAARKGAWISLDGVNETNTAEYLSKINAFKEQNLLNRILLSHDGNSFPRGGAIRKYEALSSVLIPELKRIGYTDEEIDQITVKNPQNAFRIQIRTLGPQTSFEGRKNEVKEDMLPVYYIDGRFVIRNEVVNRKMYYTIYTISGLVIKQDGFRTETHHINSACLPTGICILNLYDSHGIITSTKLYN